MSPIEQLSWEVLEMILLGLPANDDDPSQQFQHDAPPPSPSRLPLYATVCKGWARHFERRTFKSIRLKSSELDAFSTIMKDRRITCLSRLTYEVVLPTYSEHACAKFETRKEQDRNNAVLSEAIHGLFEILKTWEMTTEEKGAASPGLCGPKELGGADHGKFELIMDEVFSPMDGRRRGKERYAEDRMEYELGRRHDLWEYRYEYCVLKLQRPESLPFLSRVSNFINSNAPHRMIEPSTIAAMVSRFGNVKNIQWTCSDQLEKYPETRQQLRLDFARSLGSLSLPSLNSFELEYCHQAPSNHNFITITALHPSSPSVDCLSETLYYLSQAPELKSFRLDGPIVVSPTLFWPTFVVATEPTWPILEQYHIKFNSCTPSGGWYFVRHPSKTAADDSWDSEYESRRAAQSESDTDSDSDASDDSAIWDTYHPIREAITQGNIPIRKFRDYPNDEEILPLLEAMAKAAARMPALQVMSLTGVIDGSPDGLFEVAFIAASVPDIMDELLEDASRPRLYWQTRDWRPPEELLELWRRIVPRMGPESGLLIKFFES